MSDAGDKPTELFPARGHQVQHCFVAGYVAGHRRRTGDACLREDLEGEALVYELLCFEVLRQLSDALRKDRNLHLGTPGIGIVSAELGDNVSLLCGCQHGRSCS